MEKCKCWLFERNAIFMNLSIIRGFLVEWILGQYDDGTNVSSNPPAKIKQFEILQNG